MAQRSYNIKDLYKDINTIDGYFGVDGGNVEFGYPQINTYCRYMDSLDKCPNYLEMASSGVIYVLKNLKENYDLEYDKLAEYAILWLRYKLNQKKPYNNTQLNYFYNNYIVKNRYYNNKIKDSGNMTYKDIIDTKKELMNIKEMTKFSYPFKLLLLLYDKNSKKSGNCTHSDYAKKFADEFEKLNNDSNINWNASYRKLLFILSDDYNNLKNKCTDFPPLPEIKTPPSKLIPVLSTFSVIPVFLGIAYKTIYKKKTKKSKEEIENEYMIRRTVIVPGTVIMIDIC
ncbi:PIR protein CIR protein [Plasmodium vinckei petteri]|uniref:PIR protein CIR protein n=1 Tax=Plasmodium vinckei petteri TaxID=138298 RepID=A0A6V7SKE8_PLAVN|nr:PIR protein CIR protein [Plasmodium vinckei petteri]